MKSKRLADRIEKSIAESVAQNPIDRTSTYIELRSLAFHYFKLTGKKYQVSDENADTFTRLLKWRATGEVKWYQN